MVPPRFFLSRTAAALGLGLLASSALAAGRIDADVLFELNFARTRPADYAETLMERGEPSEALDEAVDFLQSQDPLPPLAPSAILARAAASHAADQGPRGLVGHRGSDGSNLGQRIQRYGVWGGVAAEGISYGQASARDVVRQLIVDEGVPNRSHRQDIFSTSVRHAGVGCGPHRVWGAMCVIDFAGMVQAR